MTAAYVRRDGVSCCLAVPGYVSTNILTRDTTYLRSGDGRLIEIVGR